MISEITGLKNQQKRSCFNVLRVCIFNFQIRRMKNHSTTHQPHHGISFSAVLRLLGQALKSLFESPTSREFKRLKDFIAS